jgi:multicomponent Na+:H+ antiporter subunit B
MSRPLRLVVFAAGAGGTAALFLLAVLDMPPFGSRFHPYRNHSVPAALAHATANVVSSVNFDQRGMDTLAEESILFASVVVVATLLRKTDDEEWRKERRGRVLDSTLLMGWILLPYTLLLGFDVVAHGHLTPGGGFQGGVVLGTGIHLLYVAGRYDMLRRVRPIRPFEWGEAIGTGAFACLGVAGVLATGAFLANVVPHGTFGTLLSAGTVPILNGAVGVEVASGVVVLVSAFLDQAIGLETAPAGGGKGGRAGNGRDAEGGGNR